MWPSILRDVRVGHPALAVFAVASAVGAIVTAVAWLFDARLVTGAPVWAKPFKFFISVAVYAATVAWYLGGFARRGDLPPGRLRTARAIGWGFIVVLAVELTVITWQAWRGVASHFNRATPLDSALFDLMGAFIFLLTLLHVALLALVLRTPRPASPDLVAVRWGLGVAVGSLVVGWLMVMPTPEQAAARGGGPALTQGAHTVGGRDGGPGLPLVNWSTEFGDRRVAHFVGLHAMQAVPLVALLLGGRRPDASVIAAVRAAGLAYAALTLLLAVQAALGSPLLRW